MDTFIKNIIEGNIQHIESNDWDAVYQKLKDLTGIFTLSLVTPVFTKTMLDANIDPLKYLSKVPQYYLYRENIVDNIYLRPDIITIGMSSFSQVKTLKSINLNNIQDVGYEAFSYCSGLKKIEFNGKVKIGGRAFFNCTSLESLKIGDNSSIEGSAFESCYILKNLYLPSNFLIKRYAFNQCGITDIYYDGSKEDWNFQLSHFVDSGNDFSKANIHYLR